MIMNITQMYDIDVQFSIIDWTYESLLSKVHSVHSVLMGLSSHYMALCALSMLIKGTVVISVVLYVTEIV